MSRIRTATALVRWIDGPPQHVDSAFLDGIVPTKVSQGLVDASYTAVEELFEVRLVSWALVCLPPGYQSNLRRLFCGCQLSKNLDVQLIQKILDEFDVFDRDDVYKLYEMMAVYEDLNCSLKVIRLSILSCFKP